MATKLLSILVLLCLGMVGIHAALPSEIYWNSVLPNTPMPQFIRNMLQSREDMDKKSASVSVGKEPWFPFLYNYDATKNQLHDNPNLALFFLEKNLQNGTSMNLHFTSSNHSVNGATTFLPRAKSLPFSSNHLPQIFHYFSVKPGSPEAETIKKTIRECEEPGIKGEDKFCATSLESMLDSVTSKLGKNVKAITTEVKKGSPMQKYTIRGVIKKMGSKDNKFMVCHKQNYPYAVFYCHTTETTEAYMVPLEGADGTKANVVAVCHTDTSAWNPKHLAFQVLKIKPGTFPICHFLPENHIVWVSN